MKNAAPAISSALHTPAPEHRILPALALTGAILLLFQLWGYVGWLLADIALTRAPFAVPAEIAVAVESTERLISGGAVVWLIVLIILTLRQRSLTWPLMLTIAWSLVYWQESLVNARVHAFSYNAHFLHRADWIPYLPFFGSQQPLLNQPLLMEAAVFFWLIPVASLCVTGLLGLLSRWIKSTALLVPAAAIAGSAMESSFELSGISQQLLAWNQVPAGLSIRTGTTQQWPLAELLLGAVWALPGILWFFRHHSRLQWLDPQAGPGGIKAATIRVLALSAIINLVFLAYNMVLIAIPAAAGADFPPWLSH